MTSDPRTHDQIITEATEVLLTSPHLADALVDLLFPYDYIDADGDAPVVDIVELMYALSDIGEHLSWGPITYRDGDIPATCRMRQTLEGAALLDCTSEQLDPYGTDRTVRGMVEQLYAAHAAINAAATPTF